MYTEKWTRSFKELGGPGNLERRRISMRDLRMSGPSVLAVLLLAVMASVSSMQAQINISQAADTACAVMSGQRKADRQTLQLCCWSMKVLERIIQLQSLFNDRSSKIVPGHISTTSNARGK